MINPNFRVSDSIFSATLRDLRDSAVKRKPQLPIIK